MYSYCYVCSVLGILFHCVVPCIVCVQMCTVLLALGVNPTAVNKCIISYHIISYHIISYHIISYHIISYHITSHQIYRIISYDSSIFNVKPGGMNQKDLNILIV